MVVMVEGKQYKCGGGGGGGGGKTIEMWRLWWWRRRENNRNVAVVIYSFTIYEAVLKRKKVECRVDVGSMWGR